MLQQHAPVATLELPECDLAGFGAMDRAVRWTISLRTGTALQGLADNGEMEYAETKQPERAPARSPVGLIEPGLALLHGQIQPARRRIPVAKALVAALAYDARCWDQPLPGVI